tara:strand:+ start:64 stop:483 length:420 start_codon:yes stop_codon:yes gene_type:complete
MASKSPTGMAIKGAVDGFDFLMKKLKGRESDYLLNNKFSLVDKFEKGKKTLSEVKGEIRKGMKQEQKDAMDDLKDARDSGYLKEYDKGRSKILKKKGGAITKRKMGGKVTKRPMGGKVYKVDNSGQMMVQRMYGGKIKK